METLTLTKLIKTGNSLCIVVPKNILRALALTRGDRMVLLVTSQDTLALRKVSDREINELKRDIPF